MTTSDQTTSPANTKDFAKVLVYFADDTISELFSDLLRTRGVASEIPEDLSNISVETKIITEPQFLPAVPANQHRQVLVVGNKESLKGLNALTLSRPLTELKIEQALEQFIRA